MTSIHKSQLLLLHLLWQRLPCALLPTADRASLLPSQWDSTVKHLLALLLKSQLPHNDKERRPAQRRISTVHLSTGYVASRCWRHGMLQFS